MSEIKAAFDTEVDNLSASGTRPAKAAAESVAVAQADAGAAIAATFDDVSSASWNAEQSGFKVGEYYSASLR